jgi:uncharacterized repeat protein (TIGR02543 family)
VDTNTYASGATVTLLSNSGNLTKTGYDFFGWNSNAIGNGTDYNATFVMGSANVIIYAKWNKHYSIRDTGPAGGLIFYDKGSYSSGWRYLEAAPVDQGKCSWNNGTYIATGATGTDYGTGKANTAAIILAQGFGYYAATVCTSYTGGGCIDWYLPSGNELNCMCANLFNKGVGGFSSNYYWSSTEATVQPENNALYQFFINGSWAYTDKGLSTYVRAIRQF